jgi:hypothetical protein
MHWHGAIISFIVICAGVPCFWLLPRRPRAPRSIALLLLVLPLCSLSLSGCATPPKLTAQDRRQDIEYLAKWCRDCSPLASLSEKDRGFPDCDILKPRYLQFAADAASNEDFYLVTAAYFNVVGAGSCHAYLIDGDFLKWSAVGRCLGIYDWGLSTRQLWAGTYWPRLASGISTRVHPPFRIAHKTGRYYLDQDYQSNGKTVPHDSEIIKVNGMGCSSYLGFIKTNTILRYEAFPRDWVDDYLLVVDEGPNVRGWWVDFLLADGTTLQSFIPKMAGFPPPRDPPPHSIDAKENCTCLELTDTVAYIRIKSMWHGPVGYFFKGYIKKERQRIRDFFEQSGGRYRKLIIDIRDNTGGAPEYVYENLVCPFLKGPVTFKQTSGMREGYLAMLKPRALQDLKKQYDLYVTQTRKVKAPAGFPDEGWVWHEVTRQLRPSEHYIFEGKIYVLVNGGSLSAADDYADLVQRLSLGTLLGQKTGGGAGGYVAPGIIRLPRSGMIFRAETKILLSPDGNIDEVFGTSPDVKLPPAARPASITRDDLLKDEWIKHVLTRTLPKASSLASPTSLCSDVGMLAECWLTVLPAPVRYENRRGPIGHRVADSADWRSVPTLLHHGSHRPGQPGHSQKDRHRRVLWDRSRSHPDTRR